MITTRKIYKNLLPKSSEAFSSVTRPFSSKLISNATHPALQIFDLMSLSNILALSLFSSILSAVGGIEGTKGVKFTSPCPVGAEKVANGSDGGAWLVNVSNGFIEVIETASLTV